MAHRYQLDPLQDEAAKLNQNRSRKYLDITQSFLSMTKRSMYIDKVIDHVEDRLHIVTGPFEVSLCLSIC